MRADETPMIRKTISIPDGMAAYIDERLKAGQFGNDSEYFRELVRRDQERRGGVSAIQSLIDEALESGVPARTLEDLVADARARAKARRKAARKAKE